MQSLSAGRMSLAGRIVVSAAGSATRVSAGPNFRRASRAPASPVRSCGARPMNYNLISGDSHLEIDAKWWRDRVPARFRDQAPRVVRLPDGSDAWLVEGQPLRQVPFDLYGGKGREVYRPMGQNYETTPGTGPAEQRLREQDQDGVDAEVLFPGAAGPRLWRSIRDDDVYKSVVRAYNDYLA